jgi:hypothetical protein
VRLAVLVHNGPERFWQSGFFFALEWNTEAQSKPKMVSQNNMMQESTEFVVLSGNLMVTNGFLAARHWRMPCVERDPATRRAFMRTVTNADTEKYRK